MELTSKGHFIVSSDLYNDLEFAAKSIKTNYESLSSEDSGRTDDGVMRINWIFRRIRKVEIEMPPMKAAEVSKLLSAVQGQEYYLTYFDMLDNTEKTIKVYTSNSSGECYSGILLNGLYQGVSFNAIELAGEA